MYWDDVNTVGSEPLSREQEQEVFARVQQGDQQAREQAITANLRFVMMVARAYADRGVPTEDLISHGNGGLCKAVDRFDPDRGMKFITYAVWWIRQTILHALGETTIVRIPVSTREDARKIERTAVRMAQDLGRFPAIDEAAEHTTTSRGPFSKHRVRGAKMMSEGYESSIDLPLGRDDDSKTFHDILPSHDPEINWNADPIAAALHALSPRSAAIVRMYFGLDDGGHQMTLEQIGARFNVTRERIRQLRDVALKTLAEDSSMHELHQPDARCHS